MDGNSQIKHAVNASLAYVINLREDAAECLAAYLDFQMRRGLKGSTAEQADAVFETVMTFFKSLNDRDKFENFYRSLLAQRLLRHWSVDIQYEYSMVEKLERECGYQFTSKLEGMLTDIKLSEKYNLGFLEHVSNLETNPISDIDFEFSVKVLTKSIWPKQNPAMCTLPEIFSRTCDLFRSYYLSSRKEMGNLNLVWQYNLGSSILQVNLPKITYSVKVSTYQMVILNCFNSSDFLTLRDIEKSTDISKEDLVREMHLLLKYKNLTKQSEKKTRQRR
jgi:cullin 3